MKEMKGISNYINKRARENKKMNRRKR